jgi:hypothetical protein
MTDRVVLGIGLSSKADVGEVRALAEDALRRHHLELADVATIATRERFVDDRRLQLGPPVIGYPDDVLEAMSPPCDRPVGIRARVAETAARLALGSGFESTVLPEVSRSAHATIAVGIASSPRLSD